MNCTAYTLAQMYCIFMQASLPYSNTDYFRIPYRNENFDLLAVLIFWLTLLGWFHFFHGDPAYGVPACVCVPSRVAITGTYIEPDFYVPRKGRCTVALKISFDVQFTLGVNRRVDWSGALGAIQCKEPSVACRFWKHLHVAIKDDMEMCLLPVLIKRAFLCQK